MTYVTPETVFFQQTKFVSEETNMGYYLERARSGYFKGISDSYSREMHIIWGLKPQDLDECHRTDAVCRSHRLG